MAKISKSDAEYVNFTASKEKCRDCEHYDDPNGCEKVQGSISSAGWCKLWEKKKGSVAKIGKG